MESGTRTAVYRVIQDPIFKLENDFVSPTQELLWELDL
jgi:hypothetical protein